MKIKKAYEGISKDYDKKRDRSPYFRIVESLTQRAVLENITVKPGTKALDLGCGTGRNIKIFVERGADVFCLDYTMGMLKKAVEKYKSNKRVFFVNGDAERIPFKDNSFDVTGSFKALPHVKDIDSAIREIKRVTRPGGVMFLEFYSPWSFKKTFSRYYYYTKWHSLGRAKKLIKENNLKLKKVYGCRTFIAADCLCFIPFFDKIFEWLENKFTNSWINRFSGYYIMVCKK